MNKKIKKELAALERRDGVLLPGAVVAFAADPETALHSRFEWDDAKAGHSYRLWQARQLIVKVRIEVSAQEPMEFQGYVSLKTDRHNGGGYRTITSVISDADRREQLVCDCLADLELLRAKYNAIKELTGLFVAIEEVVAQEAEREGVIMRALNALRRRASRPPKGQRPAHV